MNEAHIFELEVDHLSLIDTKFFLECSSGDGTGSRVLELPVWVDWLVRLGYFLQASKDTAGRRIIFIRLPTRRTAAAFIAFGALLASIEQYDDVLDWNALKNLESGTRVYWQEVSGKSTKKRSGIVEGLSQLHGQEFLVIATEDNKRQQTSKFMLPKATALNYGVTLGSTNQKTNNQELNDLYSEIGGASNKSWMRSHRTICDIWTELSSFSTLIKGVNLCSSNEIKSLLSNLLLITDKNNAIHGKTRLFSNRQLDSVRYSSPLTILDGDSSILRITETDSKVTVGLIDCSEYSEDIEQLIMKYAGYSEDKYIGEIPEKIVNLPTNFDVAIFGLPEIREN